MFWRGILCKFAKWSLTLIVSHKHRFIYFAVPRTATHSVRAALGPHLGVDDWQQEGLASNKRLPVPELARAGHGHIGVRALKPHLSSEQWESYFKFGLVRHPYDRFVSVCAFLNRDNPDFESRPLEWMLEALVRPRFRQRMLVKPQTEMLVDETGSLALDFIGHYEQLNASLNNVRLRTGLGELALTHQNKSPRNETSEYLDSALRKQLNEFYRKDFELLNYDMLS
ncbi:MAG: sulfotransferase family 2 domain-containing protein [Gammaproteobacteria bacterium]